MSIRVYRAPTCLALAKPRERKKRIRRLAQRQIIVAGKCVPND
jgi:hypothetical protein